MENEGRGESELYVVIGFEKCSETNMKTGSGIRILGISVSYPDVLISVAYTCIRYCCRSTPLTHESISSRPNGAKERIHT